MKTDGELKRKNLERIKKLISNSIMGDTRDETVLSPLLQNKVDLPHDKRASRPGKLLRLQKIYEIFKQKRTR